MNVHVPVARILLCFVFLTYGCGGEGEGSGETLAFDVSIADTETNGPEGEVELSDVASSDDSAFEAVADAAGLDASPEQKQDVESTVPEDAKDEGGEDAKEGVLDSMDSEEDVDGAAVEDVYTGPDVFIKGCEGKTYLLPPGFTDMRLTPENYELFVNVAIPEGLQFEVIGTLVDGSEVPLQVDSFMLVNAQLGFVNTDGFFTPNVGRGGGSEVRATVGNICVATDLSLIAISHHIQGENATAPQLFLDAFAATEPQDGLSVHYPLDNSLWPANLPPAVVQWTSAVEVPQTTVFRLSFTAPYAQIHVYGDPTVWAYGDVGWSVKVPGPAWSKLWSLEGGDSYEMQIFSTDTGLAADGTIVASEKQVLNVAKESVGGAFYYWNTNTGGVQILEIDEAANAEDAASEVLTIEGGCHGCHTISPDGEYAAVTFLGDVMSVGNAPGPEKVDDVAICLDENCPEQVAACAADSVCSDFQACILTCMDIDCWNVCFDVAQAAGPEVFDEWFECKNSNNCQPGASGGSDGNNNNGGGSGNNNGGDGGTNPGDGAAENTNGESEGALNRYSMRLHDTLDGSQPDWIHPDAVAFLATSLTFNAAFSEAYWTEETSGPDALRRMLVVQGGYSEVDSDEPGSPPSDEYEGAGSGDGEGSAQSAILGCMAEKCPTEFESCQAVQACFDFVECEAGCTPGEYDGTEGSSIEDPCVAACLAAAESIQGTILGPLYTCAAANGCEETGGQDEGVPKITHYKRHLYSVDLLSGEVVQISDFDDEASWHANFPTFSSDGSFIIVGRSQYMVGLGSFGAVGLYRIPYNDGQGGEAVALEGADLGDDIHYYPALTPDDKYVLFNRTSDASASGNQHCKTAQGEEDFNVAGTYNNCGAELWMVPSEGGGALRLDNANGPEGAGYVNSWPSLGPNLNTDYYWVAFSSARPYGIQYVDDSGFAPGPQIWIAGVSKTAMENGEDPSFAPIWLSGQSMEGGNHIAQWSVLREPE